MKINPVLNLGITQTAGCSQALLKPVYSALLAIKTCGSNVCHLALRACFWVFKSISQAIHDLSSTIKEQVQKATKAYWISRLDSLPISKALHIAIKYDHPFAINHFTKLLETADEDLVLIDVYGDVRDRYRNLMDMALISCFEHQKIDLAMSLIKLDKDKGSRFYFQVSRFTFDKLISLKLYDVVEALVQDRKVYISSREQAVVIVKLFNLGLLNSATQLFKRWIISSDTRANDYIRAQALNDLQNRFPEESQESLESYLDELFTQRKSIDEILAQDGMKLKYLQGTKLASDPNLIRIATHQNGKALKFVPENHPLRFLISLRLNAHLEPSPTEDKTRQLKAWELVFTSNML